MENCVEIKECIACGGNHLKPLLDLGSQPLANSFLKYENEFENFYPLATNYCEDCFHVQLTHKVNPDFLFKNYLYVSGTSKTQLEYFDWFAKFVVENHKPTRVLDIGCNDGSQLDAFKKYGVLTCGVDPAINLVNISSRNHHVYPGYFDTVYANTQENQNDAVICQNAFAHNYDQLTFLKNMGRVLVDDGYIYITTSQADMILNGEFDTIYHEHLSFYNIRSMNELCKRAGLNLVEVLKHPIHGNSFIFVISKSKARPSYIELLLNNEATYHLYDENTYEAYVAECKEIIEEFAIEIRNHKAAGKTVIGYGAPAKGNTLLNAANIILDFIIDDNPMKQGLFTPGMHVPVYSSEKLKEYENEDVVFVPLAWNFFEEIRTKIEKLRPNKKDAFIRYFPYVYTEQTQ
jgi:SAM-dependent methyltransferase